MKAKPFTHLFFPIALMFTGAFFSGCATTDNSTTSAGAPTAGGSHIPIKYMADDGRGIEIGRSSADNGGWRFKEPHLDKCWIADGFDFKGYDVLYIAPTLSTAKFHDDEAGAHQMLLVRLRQELALALAVKGIFGDVVTKEADIKPGTHVLKLENTIVEFSKGGGAARFFVGLVGGGQPVLRVRGKMTQGDKIVFDFEGRRSGVSASARMNGVLMSDEDIQYQDVRSLVLDLTDFVAAVAGKYPPR